MLLILTFFIVFPFGYFWSFIYFFFIYCTFLFNILYRWCNIILYDYIFYIHYILFATLYYITLYIIYVCNIFSVTMAGQLMWAVRSWQAVCAWVCVFVSSVFFVCFIMVCIYMWGHPRKWEESSQGAYLNKRMKKRWKLLLFLLFKKEEKDDNKEEELFYNVA